MKRFRKDKVKMADFEFNVDTLCGFYSVEELNKMLNEISGFSQQEYSKDEITEALKRYNDEKYVLGRKSTFEFDVETYCTCYSEEELAKMLSVNHFPRSSDPLINSDKAAITEALKRYNDEKYVLKRKELYDE